MVRGHFIVYVIAYYTYVQFFIVSLYAVAPGDVCPGVNTLVKGPKSQLISKLTLLIP